MSNNSTIRVFCIARFARWIGFSIAAVLMINASADAQNFNLEEYLKRKDTNRNGRVDPGELSDNGSGWLRKMGFDTDKPISISKIVSKAKKDRKDASSKSTKTTRERKVPGFGVEKTTESTGTSRFGATGSARSSSSKKPKYSENVMRQVDDTLRRYDRNKNGSLDRDEVRNARWGSPSPEQSDSNKDGRLSRGELANRYASREQYYRGSSSSRSDRDRELAKRKEAGDRARREKERERSRYRSTSSSGSSSSSRSSYRPTSSPSRSTSSRPSSSSSSNSQEKYEKYADSFISQYDEDKDGKLSSAETKKMRRPPAGADTDKDGYITKSELMANLSGANKSSSSAKPDKSSDNGSSSSSARNGRDRGYSPRSSSVRAGSSSSFEKLDADADRHVQMHEFATKWDDDTVEEFYEKDKNGDGVITLREWTGKN